MGRKIEVLLIVLIPLAFFAGHQFRFFGTDEAPDQPLSTPSPTQEEDRGRLHYLQNVVRRRMDFRSPDDEGSEQAQRTQIPVDPSEYKQGMWAASALFRSLKSGFFVECGAADGVNGSNTLFLEQRLGFHGLLIEPHPFNYEKLKRLNRNAVLFNGCLSKDSRNVGFVFDKYPTLSRVHPAASTTTHCENITDLLLALGRTHVDYFSLDVEGHEGEVLAGVDWDAIEVDVWDVEISPPMAYHTPRVWEPLDRLRRYFSQHGYETAAYLPVGCKWAAPALACVDAVFVRRGSGLPVPPLDPNAEYFRWHPLGQPKAGPWPSPPRRNAWGGYGSHNRWRKAASP